MKMLFIIALISTITFSVFPADCGNAGTVIATCRIVIKSQDKQIIDLKTEKKELEDKLASSSSPLLPAWMWVGIGAIVGGAAVMEFKK